MKYTLLYPKARNRDEPAPGIVYLNWLMDCFVCRDLTHFANVSLGVGMCSERCAQQLREAWSSPPASADEHGARPHEKAA